MDLIVGATGLLGTQITLELLRRGRRVRALVRRSSDAARRLTLEAAGAELVQADLRDPASLARACAGVTHVLSTASSTQSRQPGDNIDTVDRNGHLALIEAAQRARVEHFLLISFPRSELRFPLQDAKQSAEQRLSASGLAHTILQPTHFFETWFSPALGFDWENRRARLYGGGTAKVSFVSRDDVTHIGASLLGEPRAYGKTFVLGGPSAVSQLDMLREAEALARQPFEAELVDAATLERQLSDSDPLTRSFAALMLLCGAREDYRIDDRSVLEIVQRELKPASHYALEALRGSA